MFMTDHTPPSAELSLALPPSPPAEIEEVARPLRLILQPGGAMFEVAHPSALVGRHSQADVCLRVPDVSRRHCRLVHHDGIWQVYDLQSLNGVFVNGQRVAHATLNHRDVLGIGGLTFEVDLMDGQTTAILSPAASAAEHILGRIGEALAPEPRRLAS